MSYYLQELELSCNVFTNTSNNEERKSAESHIQKFKKSYSVDSYMFVLNQSNNELLIYETLSAYGEAIINNWSDLSTDIVKNPIKTLISEINLNDQLSQIFHYLLDWMASNRSRLSHSVWSQTIITISMFIKKSFSDNVIIFFNEYMNKVEEFMSSNDLKNKVIALDMIHGILEMFSGVKITNQQLKISKDGELKLRQEFEKMQLSEIFLLLVNLLNSYLLLYGCAIENESETFMKSLLSNLETILSWNFLNKVQALKWKIMPKNEYSKRFSPPTKWSNIITDLSIIEFLFKVHDKVRSNPKLGIITLSCLTQIAALKVKFLHHTYLESSQPTNHYSFSHIEFSFAFIDYIRQYFKPLRNGDTDDCDFPTELFDYEIPLMADILYQLQEHLNSTVWLDGLLILGHNSGIFVDRDGNIPLSFGMEYSQFVVQKINLFIYFYCSFCLKCINGSAAEKIAKCETIFTETIDRVLSRFASFTNFHEYLQWSCLDSSEPSLVISTSDWDGLVFQELIKTSKQCHGVLFEQFTKSHLSAPEGFRNINYAFDLVIAESCDDDLEQDVEEDDKRQFETSLCAAGFSALQCIPESLTYVTNLLHTRMLQLELVSQCDETPSFSLLEDIHWIVSIIGFTILNVSEDLMVHNRTFYSRHMDCNDLRPLYDHSREQLRSMIGSHSDKYSAAEDVILHYQRLLASCGMEDSGLPRYSFSVDLSCCDDVIRLFFLTMRSMVYCVSCCKSGKVVADLIWLLNRWIVGYINLLEDCESSTLSDVPILRVFVGQSCRQQVIDNVLRLIKNAVDRRYEDPAVMQATVNLLGNASGCLSISRILLSSEIWLKELTQAIVTTSPPYNSFGEELFSQLITCIMNVASASENEQELNAYLQILDPIGVRLERLFSSPDITKVQDLEIITCLSFLRGMVMTKWPSRLNSTSAQWSMGYCRLFDTLYPWLEKSVNVLCEHLLYNAAIMQSLLECFLQVSKSVLLELNPSQTTKFYLLNLNIFRLYSRKSFNEPVISKMSKEVTMSEINVIFSIASELLSRQVFDEFDLDSSKSSEEILGYDVIAQLIYQLAPFISSEILEVPEVGTVFFHCITLVAEFKASTFLVKMNYEFNSSLLELLGNSVLNTNSHISAYSLRAICAMADEYYSCNFIEPDNQIQLEFSLVNEFNSVLAIIFNWLRANDVPNDMLDTVSRAMIALVKLSPDYFLGLVSEWLRSLNNSSVSTKVEDCIKNLNLTPEKGSFLSSFHRDNILQWNNFVQLINNHGDLYVL